MSEPSDIDENLGEVDAGEAQGGATASEGIAPSSEVDPETNPDEEAEEEIPEEIQYEAAVGATSTGIATNNALRSLSRAARSFLLYEPRNQAIRDFLQDYRENMNATLAAHGTMALDIRPFEMTRDGEVVYIERDRERSLAFRLFRDGVRRITLEPGVAWEELLRLLEILSIRYTGIRQSEDDIVTLLWKAGFKHIGIVAVEGFVPEEERPEGSLADQVDLGRVKKRRRRPGVAHIDAPPDFDSPFPNFDEQASAEWVEVPQDRLAAIASEADSLHLPKTTVHLISRLLRVVQDATDPTELSDVLPLINEVRDFLLSEGQLEHLTALVRVLESHRDLNEDEIDAVLGRCADTRALRRILQSVGKGSETLPPELVELLEMIPSEHLQHLMDLLVEERGSASRRLTRLLIEHFVRETWDPGFVFERMHREVSGVLVDILRATSRAIPDRSLQEAVQLASHQALEVQMEVLWVLGRSDDEALVESTLLQMLNSDYAEVRVRVLEYLHDYGSKAVFQPTADMVQKRSTRGITDRECEAAGKVLSVVDPDRAKPMMLEWIRPPGMFKRFVEMPGAQAMQRTAMHGLADVPGKEVDKVIRWLSERCAEEIYKVCMKTLVHRRKEGLSRD